MQLRINKQGESPAFMRELVRLLAQVDAEYLAANPSLPCCPKCSGIGRNDSQTLTDVAHCIAAGEANAASLAAWHLAEAWGSGDAAADVNVEAVDGRYKFTISKRGEPLDIEKKYELAGGNCGCAK